MNVKINQIWSDKDKRRSGRTFKVVSITDNKAVCEVISRGTTEGKTPIRIRLDRFQPKYYSLDAEAAVGEKPPVMTSFAAAAPTIKDLYERATYYDNGWISLVIKSYSSVKKILTSTFKVVKSRMARFLEV